MPNWLPHAMSIITAPLPLFGADSGWSTYPSVPLVGLRKQGTRQGLWAQEARGEGVTAQVEAWSSLPFYLRLHPMPSPISNALTAEPEMSSTSVHALHPKMTSSDTHNHATTICITTPEGCTCHCPSCTWLHSVQMDYLPTSLNLDLRCYALFVCMPILSITAAALVCPRSSE